MALQLIVGGSGSGKTTWLYDAIIKSSIENPERHHFLIVPEQFTMQAQKDIVMCHPRHGFMNIDVVSFQRLAYRIFEELSVENLQALDEMGKSMVLRRVAAEKRKELLVFGGHLNKPGFISQLKSMVSEFGQYGVTPEFLEEIAPDAKSELFRQKLKDFALIFRSFREYIEGHYITTEEILDVLCRVLPRSEMIANSIIAMDGFAGFMPVQFRLAELCMVYARDVMVTVTADPGVSLYRSMGIQNLFYLSREMAMKLSLLAEKNQVAKLPDRIMPEASEVRFKESPELAWLESHLFRYGGGAYEGEMRGGIELFEAQNPSTEIGGVVHRIRRLVAVKGLRYRDVAVITADLKGYGGEIAHQFERNKIPYFMDDKKNVLDNPAVELIRSALEAVRLDFSYESVIRFLRTGLVTDNREMTDRLENYVLALGIRGGKRYRESWKRTYRGAANLNLVELNAFKDEALAPLFAMQEAFRQENLTVGGMVQAVKELLTACRVEEKLGELQNDFTERKEYRLAKEYSQVYEKTAGLLDRLKDLLGDEKVSRKEFAEILDAGFAEVSVGVIPSTVDRVVVGDIMRSRLAHVKVLLFVGVNDGIIPARNDGGSLISDKEREFFGAHHLKLAPTAREDSFFKRFYLYLMMTKPSQKLVVSFSRVGGDGKTKRPSYLVSELRAMFPSLVCREEGTDETGAVYSAEEARLRLIDGLRRYRDGEREDGQFLELYRWFLESPGRKSEALRLLDAAFYVYEKKGIGHAAARALYGSILSGSVTRLEQYAACAYGHFLKYGLELAERQRYELAAADIGNLFHDSIDLCFQRVKDEGRDWRAMTDEERTGLVRACVEQVTGEYGNTILKSSSRNAYLARRVEHIAQRTVWALQQQIVKGDFTPAGFEVSFSAADNLDAMKIALSDDEALHLRGRVDRLDLCEDGDTVYIKIIDYKSGSTSFDLLKLYYGLQLQLVVYLDAVTELVRRRYPGKDAAPAAILYYNISDPVVNREGREDQAAIDERILKELRMNGLVNSELSAVCHLDHTIEKESDIIPVVLKDGEVESGRSSVANRERFGDLSRFVHEKLKEAGREILDGEIAVSPYKSGQRTACDYCPYHAVCGFDKKSSGFEYRRWKNKKSEEIWEEICQKRQ